MGIHIKITGLLLMILALIHTIFPRYFRWKEELSQLSLINRQLMTVHTFFIAFMVFLMGVLCVTSSSEMVQTEFGRRVSLGLGIFWMARLMAQFFGYSSELWRGKRLETAMHVVFSILWVYISSVFILTYLIYS